MKTGISAAIRHLIEQHIVADDPVPQRSWLDMQDMPRVQERLRPPVAGLRVDPLPPLTGQHADQGRHPQRPRRQLRDHSAAIPRGDGS